MLITREMDYMVRVLRAVRDGAQHAAPQIVEAENMPPAITYKLLKRLTKAGLLVSQRGQAGGYRLARPAQSLTLYDVFAAVEQDLLLTECLRPDYDCPNNAHSGCGVHREFCRIQKNLAADLRQKTLAELFDPAMPEG